MIDKPTSKDYNMQAGVGKVAEGETYSRSFSLIVEIEVRTCEIRVGR